MLEWLQRIKRSNNRNPLSEVREKLLSMPRFTPGNIDVLGWDIDFVDGHALWSCIDVLVIKGWNNFVTNKSNPIIIDCGANIGISVLNYKRHFPGAHVIAFEPDPTIVKVLRRNLEVNKVENVQLIDSAAWIENGYSSFFTEGIDGSRIIDNSDVELPNVTVKTADLRQYVQQPIDLLKMDIEGAEFKVLCHLGECLKLVQNLVVECHVNSDNIGDLGELLGVLQNVNFEVSMNSYGVWRDLIHRPEKLPNEFDQYFLVTAWRK